jgi:alkylhydroperoxidase family enzyme
MARIPLVEPEEANAEVRVQYERFQSWGFPILNVFKMFANHPLVLRGFGDIVESLYKSPTISTRYRELAYLRASQLNSCHY